MNATQFDIESRALDQIEPRLLKRGYRLIRAPLPEQLPNFVGRYVPDAIAIGKEPKIALEIKGREGRDAERSLIRIREMFEGHEDWIFEAYYFSSLEPKVTKLPVEVLVEREREVLEMVKRHPQAAFILAWSVVEASVRDAGLLENEQGGIGPSRLIALLASEGYVAGADMQDLLELAGLRNQIVHGQLNEFPSEGDARRLVELARLVRDETRENERVGMP